MEVSVLVPVKYRVGRYAEPLAASRAVHIEERMQRDGAVLWAVTWNGMVLGKDGEWEHEPQPSSRGDAFLARTRFATLADAATAVNGATHVV